MIDAKKFKAICAELHLDPLVTDGLWLKVKAELSKPDKFTDTQKAIAAYCEAWKDRFCSEHNPTITGVGTKALKAIVESKGLERTSALLTHYVHMNDSWFAQRGFSLDVFTQNLDRIALDMEGKAMNRTQANVQERRQANRQVVRDYAQKGKG